jgi:hypothetical protein
MIIIFLDPSDKIKAFAFSSPATTSSWVTSCRHQVSRFRRWQRVHRRGALDG